jgi:hypothetical protein
MRRKKLDGRIVFRATAPLIAELENIASSEGRTLAELARVVLVDYAARRVVERERAAA